MSIDVNDGMMKLMPYIWNNVWVVLVCVHYVGASEDSPKSVDLMNKLLEDTKF